MFVLLALQEHQRKIGLGESTVTKVTSLVVAANQGPVLVHLSLRGQRGTVGLDDIIIKMRLPQPGKLASWSRHARSCAVVFALRGHRGKGRLDDIR